jgi:hypothetical protein
MEEGFGTTRFDLSRGRLVGTLQPLPSALEGSESKLSGRVVLLAWLKFT